MVPIVAVIFIGLTPGDEIWSTSGLHRSALIYISTTLQLMIGVGIGTLIIGVGTAWLVSTCRFPGKSIFEWALLLPMAMPAYVIAYVYTDILEYAGTVQGLLAGPVRLDNQTGILVPGNPFARRRRIDDDIGSVPLCLSAVARLPSWNSRFACWRPAGSLGGDRGGASFPSPCRWPDRPSSSACRWC